jgi:ubiquinone/menaquinone biosynthesis C-methylase UbiE
MAKTQPFDSHLAEYERWFIDHHYVFQSELAAIQNVIPPSGTGMEVGIGSGIFAKPLGIKEGVEPSLAMREKAMERGIHPTDGIAEELPYPDNSFDFVLMVTTICFVDDLEKSFSEAGRVLKSKGSLINGFVDKNSPLGKMYLMHKDESLFYRDAVFWSTEEVYGMLDKTGFKINITLQTVFGSLDSIGNIQEPEEGYGKGSFVVIKASRSI